MLELWLDEQLELEYGRALKIRVLNTLASIQTPYQKIDVFETQAFGKVFTLDGVIMMTEKDEFAYHEMISHVPLLSHSQPQRVLVVGGGDGGTVREVLKHPSVKEVHLCEIDRQVVEMSSQFFPEIAAAMQDAKVQHIYQDGAKYVEQMKGYFDIILVDSSDPIGPAEVLFQKPFYQSMQQALRQSGICVTQAESYYYHGDIISSLFRFIPDLFKKYSYYWTAIPTYPSGMIGFTFLSDTIDPAIVQPDEKRIPEGLKYYNHEIHQAAFVLPNFARKYLQGRFE